MRIEKWRQRQSESLYKLIESSRTDLSKGGPLLVCSETTVISPGAFLASTGESTYGERVVADLLDLERTGAAALSGLLRPDRLPDGAEPESRVVVYGLGWERYLALDKALGDDRPGPRFYYLDGELEIMSTSDEHERIKKWIADCLAVYFRFKRIRVAPRGQATMRDQLKLAGAEPDESWCIGHEKKFPDFVLEIALTSGGLPKLEIYGRMRVPEVWFSRNNKLEFFVLTEGRYEQRPASQLLPELDPRSVERCVTIPDWLEALDAFHAALENR